MSDNLLISKYYELHGKPKEEAKESKDKEYAITLK